MPRRSLPPTDPDPLRRAAVRLRGLALLVVLLLAAAPVPSAGQAGQAGQPDRVGELYQASAVQRTAAADEALGRAVNEAVRQARRSSPQIGVLIEALDSGEAVYSYNPDELRIIASNTKLFTSAAALHYLGPGYVFETPLLVRGRVAGGVLTGDLAVVGAGDPTISERFTLDPYSAFRSWAEALRERGVLRVEGDLYLAHGFFEDLSVHPDWPRDQLSRWYEAPVAALSFNDNCVWVRVSPTGAGRARVDVLPALGRYPVQNLTRIGSSSRQHQVVVTRQPEAETIEVRGYVWRNADPLDAWVTVPDPVAYFGDALLDALAEEGIRVTGRTRPVERVPGGAWERVAEHRTSLLTALDVVNKRSQNFYAECVLKTLGAERCGGGSWAQGVEGVAQFLEREVGIPRGSYRMADGSGMSRANRFTPRQLVTLLRHMYYHRWGRAFLQTLPYSGEEGLSWERRLAAEPYRQNVFAKTGTLSGVSTLSGYAKGRSGRLYAFSILGNGTSGAWAARQGQDAILRALIDNG